MSETTHVVGEPLHHILALFAIGTTGFAVTSVVDGNRTCRWPEPTVVVAILVVGKHHLCGEVLIFHLSIAEKWQDIEFNRSVPVEQLGICMVFFQFLALHRI